MHKNKVQLPTDALVAVTYSCNAKCIMCNIWKERPQNELKPEEFAKLPASLKDINITGGEPFLRTDLPDIVQNITDKNPKVRLVISSNGFLTDRIVNFMNEIRKINRFSCIALSLDGIGEMHDEIRGINNAYDKVIRTITGLKKSGFNDIRIGYTASKHNVSHLEKVYNLSQDLGIEFTMSIVHNSDNYFSIDTNQSPDSDELEDQLKNVIYKEYRSINPRRLLRTYYLKGLIDYSRTKKRALTCQALDDFFFLDSFGNVFPCNMLEKSIGNIRESSFEEIWNSDKKQKLRNYCKNCNDCWMVCTAKSSIRREAIKVSTQVLKEAIPARLKTMTT